MAVFTNLFTNPRVASATFWAAIPSGTGTISQTIISNAAGPGGDTARRITWTAGTTSPGGGVGFATGTAVAATSGSPYSVAAYVRCSKAQTVYPRIQWVDAASAGLGILLGAPVTLVADTWTELKLENQIAPASTAFIRGGLVADALSSNWVTGDTLDGQAGTIAQSATLPQPFHGAMTDDATHDYAWTGTADASTSTLTVPDTLAAPTGLAATPISANQINVSWNAVSGATGYDIERDGVVIVTGQAGTTYADTGRAPATLYSYRVRSSN